MTKLYALYRAGRRAVGLESRPATRTYQATPAATTDRINVYLGDGVLCDALR